MQQVMKTVRVYGWIKEHEKKEQNMNNLYSSREYRGSAKIKRDCCWRSRRFDPYKIYIRVVKSFTGPKQDWTPYKVVENRTAICVLCVSLIQRQKNSNQNKKIEYWRESVRFQTCRCCGHQWSKRGKQTKFRTQQ